MSLPEEFVSTTKAILGPQYTKFEASLSEDVPVSIRWNPLKSPSPENHRVSWTTHGQYLAERPTFTLDPVFHAGGYYVQEASSMLLKEILKQAVDLKDDLAVLDLCAAPGGKSTHLISLLSENSLLVSNEVIRSRASILAENMQKWGYPNMVITNNDPQDFDRLHFQFDVIVVDAPCSGEGLFRKDPTAMNEWSPENVKLCSSRQQRILADIWSSLKPGGVLIYSTCTYNEAENEQNLAWLEEQFDVEPVDIELPENWGFTKTETSGIRGFHAYLHKVKGEGFFIAAVRKTEGRTKKLKKTKQRHPYTQKKLIAHFESWIKDVESRFFINHHDTILALPEHWHNELLDLNQNLYIITEGLKIGDEKKNKVVPDPALALSILLNREAFHLTQLNRQEALRYLKKEAFDPDDLAEGLNLMVYEDELNSLPLGWARRIGHRVNNNYPTAWRIRMGL